MSLITCPECGNSISDKAEKCPHCGLPSAYFRVHSEERQRSNEEIDYGNLNNVLLSFDRDHTDLFNFSHYISHRDAAKFRSVYDKYYTSLKNELIRQYVYNHASSFRIDTRELGVFLRKMGSFESDVAAHNTNYVEDALRENEGYFDGILKDIDPMIRLDEEQRRAVVIDDDYCLLVAGAGAGKTTTMAAIIS